jgi:hypothetical protein
MALSKLNNDSFADTAVHGQRNLIINGAMVIDQRNGGAAVSTNGSYPTDRWQLGISGGTWSVQQSTTTPDDFKNSTAVTISTGYSKSASHQNNIRQFIEGQNLYDLNYGTSAAKTTTLSFWVRSSLTGTFAGSLMNSAYNRSYVFTYSISSANTWEYKTITIAGDTSGTWLTTNGVGIRLFFDLGSGSNYDATAGAWSAGEYRRVSGAVDVVATTGATWQITGVQLEVGKATPFEHRSYGDELARCQRYYQKITGITSGNTNDGGFIAGTYWTSSKVFAPVQLNPTMRIAPTMGVSSIGNIAVLSSGNSDSATGFSANGSTNKYVEWELSGISGTGGNGAWVRITGGSSNYIDFDAEL